MDAAIKKIPYGMTDFERIILENYYYVDKTQYIAKVEKVTSFFFFVRPRRFGKSLFLNMLGLYYDINQKDKFEKIFGNLYIGKHPTPDRNKYLVLTLNFSSVAANMDRLEETFNTYCKIVMDGFAERNAHLLGKEAVEKLHELKTGDALLGSLCQSAQNKGQKIYLILDEYDNFANNILVDYGNKRYRSITHGSGFFRSFLKVVKDYSSSVIERIFLTGVSPVTMDDLTSGFNIADNYSSNSAFNNMIGFNEYEVRALIDYYKSCIELPHSTDELIDIMKPWYDNYCFSIDSLDEPPMYNSDMVLYFMNRYLLNKRIPNNMLDANIRTDYNKLRHLIHVDKTFGENASVVQEIVEKGSTTGIIIDSFPAEDIVKTRNFKSLLYYYGMLTISGMEMGEPILSVPNWAVREQLYGYMADIYKDSADLYLETDKLVDRMKRMAYKGEWENCFTYIADRLNAQSSVRDFIEGEAYVKTFILAYLGLTHYYIARPEYESNKGYADIFLQPRLLQLPDMVYSYCIEVKYAKRDVSDTEIEKLLSNAKIQLKQYAASEWIHQDKGTTELKSIALVFQGWKLVRVEEV
ncbi:ATP-binding protein [Bacteroides thetaiotaomicron]|uniref:ATP-binding protein n=1 Tax=Bacteroides thetaiotaomicron TaxID=818 RepID=A0A6I0N5U7_BACT4|nr:ATP-binding protein [Bacteroides thetaiotaomicron]KAB4269717.1 ATP-binding protein [Bacteroides thetaiotaomicron]KAB4276489.1 ATP-binding protein [Bacteroides thetaiotaomicron]KAB4276803.1 ATP-binding protein [Bacteroides thetaiotaomicron]KAB4278869.1 ATP-binding protein [Bacteroides thetaiotaomicron]KAB4289512.1 ATP-binding protein [Bacteroides thetaiotaomicron]